ncbi:12796_t:CDS:2, partial [Entrophospora sp. SA101]
ENFHSLVRRHTNAKNKKSYPYSKQNIDLMIKSGAIFLLRFFDNLLKNIGKFEKKLEGHHSNQHPHLDCFCDSIKYENPYLINGHVKLCNEFEPPIDELLQEEESNQVDTVPIYEEVNQQ